MHHFITWDRSPGSLEGSKPLLGVDAALDGSMVLLNDVVQVGTDSTPATPTEPPLLLQLLHYLGVRGIAVDVDDAGARMIGRG